MSLLEFTYRQPGGLPECPYFHRTVLKLWKWSIRIHEWHKDDDTRHMHDHPFWFLTIVLKGGYVDVSDRDWEGSGTLKVTERLSMGSIRFRPADYRHCVTQVVPGTITLLITGPSTRRWGFWVMGKLIKRDKYFAVHGHHPCDDTQAPVRLKPGGGRI